jgi:hypothetical protein
MAQFLQRDHERKSVIAGVLARAGSLLKVWDIIRLLFLFVFGFSLCFFFEGTRERSRCARDDPKIENACLENSALESDLDFWVGWTRPMEL